MCAITNILRFIKGEEVSGPLSRLKMRISLKKIPLLGETKCLTKCYWQKTRSC